MSRLETKQETLILPNFGYGSDPETHVKDKTTTRPRSAQKKQINLDNYKRIALTFHNVLIETAES